MASASGSSARSSSVYRSARHPVTSTVRARPCSFRAAASSTVSIDSRLAASTNAQVLTTTASACSGSATTR